MVLSFSPERLRGCGRIWSMFPRLWLALVPVWSALSFGQRLDSWNDLRGALSDGLCRYGNSVECCWGWSLKHGRCRPHCPHGCKHGDCVAPGQCRCEPGFTGKTCNHDLNECGLKPRPCKHRCMNTPGSYKCYCADGYRLQPDGSCRNAHTCFHANCQYGCEVMKGRVRCTCPSPGLRLSPDRRTCADINECVSMPGVCPHRRKCVNTFGSFVCKCHFGFRLSFIDGLYSCIGQTRRTSVTFVLATTTTATSTTKTTPVTTSTTTTTTPPTTTTLTPMPTTTVPTTTTTIAPTTTTTSTTTTTTTTLATTTPPTTTSTLKGTTTTFTTPVPSSSPVPWETTEQETASIKQTTESTTLILKSTTSSSPTTTVNNHINKEVTHRQRGDVHNTSSSSCSSCSCSCSSSSSCSCSSSSSSSCSSSSSSSSDVVDLECSFDRGLCSWISEREGDVNWEISQGPAGMYCERYLSVPPLKPGHRSLRGARLSFAVAPPFSLGPACFSFSHWLTGHQVGVVQVFLRSGRDQRYGSAVWSRTRGHGWRQTQVTLDKNSVDRILLKAERRSGFRGQIAVDDLKLRRGPCR
ncbi:hypothetical protein NQD34_013400 [Periophthalmus magnuspinnatus]|nr:hypothetical protein NQD34_013400 [Periophthalmus magnuspinnatus]